MLISGYEDDPLVDGAPRLSEPLFWPAYLTGLIGDDQIAGAFGAETGDIATYFEEVLFDTEAWPVFHIPLSMDYAFYVIWRNFDDDPGVDFLLSHSDWKAPQNLASIEGHFRGPALSWPELCNVSTQRVTGPGVTDPSARMLLLLPAAIGDGGVPAYASATTSAALRIVGAAIDHLAAMAVGHSRDWGTVTWQRDDDGALVCDGDYSPRNPWSSLALTPESRMAITHAFSAH